MAIKVEMYEHSDEVRAQMDANKLRAVTAMGIKAVNLVLRHIQSINGHTRHKAMVGANGEYQRHPRCA